MLTQHFEEAIEAMVVINDKNKEKK
jgi:hypothetical protein